MAAVPWFIKNCRHLYCRFIPFHFFILILQRLGISITGDNEIIFFNFWFYFQDLCRINNQLLIALGVGHPKIDQICTLLARYGIHPKMTGAGGGGSVFAFLKPGC